MSEYVIAVDLCPRCGTPHRAVKIRPLTRAEHVTVASSTHWGFCADTGEPILVNLQEGVADTIDQPDRPPSVPGLLDA